MTIGEFKHRDDGKVNDDYDNVINVDDDDRLPAYIMLFLIHYVWCVYVDRKK